MPKVAPLAQTATVGVDFDLDSQKLFNMMRTAELQFRFRSVARDLMVTNEEWFALRAFFGGRQWAPEQIEAMEARRFSDARPRYIPNKLASGKIGTWQGVRIMEEDDEGC